MSFTKRGLFLGIRQLAYGFLLLAEPETSSQKPVTRDQRPVASDQKPI